MRKTRILNATLAAIALIAAPATARAVTVFFDDFTTAGTLVGTTPDIGGVWGQTGTIATTPILSTGALVALTTGQDSYSAFTAALPNIAGNTIHTVADVNVATAVAAGDYFLHLTPAVADGSLFYQRLFARSSGNGYQLGLLDTSTGSTTTWGTTVLNFGQAYHLDVFWNFVAGDKNDTFEVLVDLNSYLTHTWTSTNSEPAQLAAANLRQGGSTTAPALTVDNYAVEGTIPEPASASLVALGVLALTAMRRRR